MRHLNWKPLLIGIILGLLIGILGTVIFIQHIVDNEFEYNIETNHSRIPVQKMNWYYTVDSSRLETENVIWIYPKR